MPDQGGDVGPAGGAAADARVAMTGDGKRGLVERGGGPVSVAASAGRAGPAGAGAGAGAGAAAVAAVGSAGRSGAYREGRQEEGNIIVANRVEEGGFYSKLSCARVLDDDGVELDVPPLAGVFAGGGAEAAPAGTR